MKQEERSVLRCVDGRVLKGFLQNFEVSSETIAFRDVETGEEKTVSSKELKAIFFVRSFEGNPDYRESKAYGARKKIGQKIFIKFKDGENIVGYLEGQVPWEKGFFLTKKKSGAQGFYIQPVDEQSNNLKMFVFSSAVQAVTVVP